MLVLFDLCDTLYGVNTTVGFLRHYAYAIGHGRLQRGLRRWGSKRSPAFWLGALALRLGRDLARERLVAALEGEPRDRLAAAASDYARAVLPALANAPLHERLATHRDSGDRVIIVSSSLDIVVAPTAAQLGVDYRASVLGFDHGICTGRLEADLTGSKHELVEELRRAEGERLRVYTDNRSDRRLLELSDEAVIVVPAGRPQPRWGKDDCEYIRL